jgi:hypothetical protein
LSHKSFYHKNAIVFDLRNIKNLLLARFTQAIVTGNIAKRYNDKKDIFTAIFFIRVK